LKTEFRRSFEGDLKRLRKDRETLARVRREIKGARVGCASAHHAMARCALRDWIAAHPDRLRGEL